MTILQVFVRFPELGEYLATSVNNDLTYNIKSSNCYVIHNKLNIPSYMAEKEVQTNDYEIKQNEMRDYILNHKREVMEILGISENDLKSNNLSPAYPASPSGSTNSVKFKFDQDMMSFSPTNGGSNNNLNSSELCKRSGSPKKILKKQTNIRSLDPDATIDHKTLSRKGLLQRSYSLCGTNGEIPPNSEKTFSKDRKQKWLEMSALQKFQVRFSSKSSTSVEESRLQENKSAIPEIILNIPDDNCPMVNAVDSQFMPIKQQNVSLNDVENDDIKIRDDNHV